MFVSGLSAHLMQGFKGGKCCHRQGDWESKNILQVFDQFQQYFCLKKCMTSFLQRRCFQAASVFVLYATSSANSVAQKSNRYRHKLSMTFDVECNKYFQGKPSLDQTWWMLWQIWSLISLWGPWRIVLQVSFHEDKLIYKYRFFLL